MQITYIPDAEFHQRIDLQVAPALAENGDLDREAVDRQATEALLAEGIWPATWMDLMPEDDKTGLIDRITAERRSR